MAATDTQKAPLSPEEIKTLTDEIEGFKQKSLQHASSSKALSAHYNRLYLASKRSLKRFDRIQRSLEDKQYNEERRKASGTAKAS